LEAIERDRRIFLFTENVLERNIVLDDGSFFSSEGRTMPSEAILSLEHFELLKRRRRTILFNLFMAID
jgi:hypothetical protein